MICRPTVDDGKQAGGQEDIPPSGRVSPGRQTDKQHSDYQNSQTLIHDQDSPFR